MEGGGGGGFGWMCVLDLGIFWGDEVGMEWFGMEWVKWQ